LEAARRLRARAASLSKQIRDMETELGVTLFQASSAGVRLTSAGGGVLADARGTLESGRSRQTSARSARQGTATSDLEFAHGELSGPTNANIRGPAGRSSRRPPGKSRCTCRERACGNLSRTARGERSTSRPSFYRPTGGPSPVRALRLVDCTTKGVLLQANPRSRTSVDHLADAEPHVAELLAKRSARLLPDDRRAVRDRGLITAAGAGKRPGKETTIANMQMPGRAWSISE